jgi:putative flavoprotein involved in K+ transport
MSSVGQHHDVIVIGGGQAGLSVSWYLKKEQIDHVVLEKHYTGYAWQEERWDTFCLVTPNWQCRLPGFDYAGNDPYGFMVREEIVQYLKDFAASFHPPIINGVQVTKVSQAENGIFQLETSKGLFTASQIVFATGGYQIPIIPRCAEKLPRSIVQIHSSSYKNPESMPPGAVLVVGTGQSGSQIAEDLHLAGRQTYLCVGNAPRVARFYRGRDVVEWLDLMGYYDMPVSEHPLREGVRDKTNHYVTGRDGGHEIDLRMMAMQGMELFGVLQDIDGDEILCAEDLEKNLDSADATSENIKQRIDAFIAKNDFDAPVESGYVPVWRPPHERPVFNYREANIQSVIWCIGFRTDYSWIDLPLFNGRGSPKHVRGVSNIPGVYFAGLPWLHTWGSGRFSGIARDAAFLAENIRAWAADPRDGGLLYARA